MERKVWMSSIPRFPLHHRDDHPPVAVEALDLLHLLRRELEVKDVGVLLNPGRSDRLWDDYDPPLDLPPNEHLGRGLGVLGGNGLDLWVIHQQGVSWLGPGPVRGAKGGVGSDGDALLLAEGEELGLPQVRMALHLVRHRLHASLLQDVCDLLRVEVGQPDRLGQPLLHQLLHGKPGCRWVDFCVILDRAILILWKGIHPSLKSNWPVDEIEIEVVNPKVSQGFPTSCFNVLRVVLCVPKLARDEDLRSGNTGGNNSCSNFSLVAITGSTVKVAIAFPRTNVNKKPNPHLRACSTAASTCPGLLFHVPSPSSGIFVPLFKVSEVSIAVVDLQSTKAAPMQNVLKERLRR